MSLVCLKGRFPFRVGSTSFVIPADVRPNARHVAPFVDDVEIVIFESPDLAPLPEPAVVRDLARLAEDHDITWTIHLPLDTVLGAADKGLRDRSVWRCLAVMDRMAPLAPFAWICHLHGEVPGPVPAPDIGRWQDNNRRSVQALAERAGPGALCLENLDYSFDLVSPLLDQGLFMCLDVGHALIRGEDPETLWDRHEDRIRVVHLHGVDGHRDHRSLEHLDPGLLRRLVGNLSRPGAPARVATLEVFGEKHLAPSLAVLSRLIGPAPA